MLSVLFWIIVDCYLNLFVFDKKLWPNDVTDLDVLIRMYSTFLPIPLYNQISTEVLKCDPLAIDYG